MKSESTLAPGVKSVGSKVQKVKHLKSFATNPTRVHGTRRCGSSSCLTPGLGAKTGKNEGHTRIILLLLVK